jgi:hypothetical protein
MVHKGMSSQYSSAGITLSAQKALMLFVKKQNTLR